MDFKFGVFLIISNALIILAEEVKQFVTIKNFPLESFDVNISTSTILVGPQTPVYLLNSKSLNDNTTKKEVEVKIRNRRYVKEKIIPVPDTVYPEILIIVDYHLYKNYNESSIISYLLSFWDRVDELFSPLKDPKFKLSIGGIVIAQDDKVFDFLTPKLYWWSQPGVNYHQVRQNMSQWLSRAKKAIPFYSYDTFIIMTRSFDAENSITETIGSADPASACSGETSNYGGITHVSGKLRGVRTAAHELGHIFGADHDGVSCGWQYLMAASDNYGGSEWSQCSMDTITSSLQQQNWTCLYNKPDHTKTKDQVIYEISATPEPKIKTRAKSFYKHFRLDKKLSVTLNNFSLSKNIDIFYIDDMMVVSQSGSPSSVVDFKEKKELKYRIPDYRRLELNPLEIDPAKEIHIYHENRSIYVYQGSKPENITHNQSPPTLDVTFEDEYKLQLSAEDFDFEKLVLIYYKNNKTHVTQKNAPENKNLYAEEEKFLKYVGSDQTTIHLCPSTLIEGIHVNVEHQNNSIFVYHFNKPNLSDREEKSETIKYLPDP